MTDLYVGVYLLDAPLSLDRLFDYRVPSEFGDVVKRGSFVEVPFGSNNAHKLALVGEVKTTTDCERVKPILTVCAEQLSVSEELLGLALFMKEQTLCTVGDAVRAILPAASLSCMQEYYAATEKDPGGAEKSDPLLCELVSYLKSEGPVTAARLSGRFGQKTADLLHTLRLRGLVQRRWEYRDRDPGRYTPYYSLGISPAEAKTLSAAKGSPLRSAKQKAVLAVLAGTEGRMAESALTEAADCSGAVLNALVLKGYLRREEEADWRLPYRAAAQAAAPVALNEEQSAAFETIAAQTADGLPHAFLLHGVTGSGKTALMLSLIDKMLREDKGVIVLLPEISLTPQSIAVFSARFGDSVAVVHSGLSQGERYDAYMRIRLGKARVVVGTRSAVFAPVDRLGFIIVDEEQEHTYKSDMNPKYRTQDVARYRCAVTGASLLLASATPSLESYRKAKEGIYTLLRLSRRYGGAALPAVTVCDMRTEAAGEDCILGNTLATALGETLEKGEQAILFLNRRGFHRFVSCRKCGTALTCPNCSLSLTYHTAEGSNWQKGYLVCHFCGKRLPLPETCPACGSPHLSHGGYGTQRVEKELCDLFPRARVLRMDTDTTSSRYSYDKLLGDFRAHRADILLGTQMVTKGHDFPDVTLVGVLNADSSLYLDDYRANERTFAMITQVVGRAGRGRLPGRAVIQTVNPDNEILRLACAQDYESFYEREVRLRKLLVFPPFCDIALFTLSSEQEKELLLAAAKLYEETDKLLKSRFSALQVSLFGPFEAPLYRAENHYRMRLVMKCRLNKETRAFLGTVLTEVGSVLGKVQLSVDLNPSNL